MGSDIEDETEDRGKDIFDDPDFQHMSDSDLDDKLPLFENDDTDDDGESNAEDEQNQKKIDEKENELENKASDYMENAMKALKSNQGSISVTENKFFKLDEMENFLDAEDAKAMKDKKDDNDAEDDDDIDYFGSDMDQDDSEAAALMYNDFFDQVQEPAG